MNQACVMHVHVPLQYIHIHDLFMMMEMTIAICHPFKHCHTSPWWPSLEHLHKSCTLTCLK